MMRVNIKLFAAIKEIVGKGEIELSLQENTDIASVLNLLEEQFPPLSKWKGFLRFAVNNEYVSENFILKAEDEIAVISPVSGG